MGIILWFIFGGLVGWVASLIMKTDSSQGIFLNIAIGIIGAFIGGLIMNVFGQYGITGFNIWSFAIALLGSVILIGIVKMVRA